MNRPDEEIGDPKGVPAGSGHDDPRASPEPDRISKLTARMSQLTERLFQQDCVEELIIEDDPERLQETVLAKSRELGCPVTNVELAEWEHILKRRWLERWITEDRAHQPTQPKPNFMLHSLDPQFLVGWTPIQVREGDLEPLVDWAYLPPSGEHFFDHRVDASLQLPLNRIFRPTTRISSLEGFNEARSDSTGFVFHMSRCGSTLTSRMLACLDRSYVLCEPSLLGRLIALRTLYSEESMVAWTRWLVRAMNGSQASRYFIKFEARTTLDLAFLRQVFPNVPWVFLYRDPVEVMVSNLELGGSWMEILQSVPLAEYLRIGEVATQEKLLAIVLAQYCRCVLGQPLENSLVVDYVELPNAVEERLLSLFGIDPSPQELVRMREMARYKSKSPGQLFRPDGQVKRAKSPQIVVEVAQRWVQPLIKYLRARQ